MLRACTQPNKLYLFISSTRFKSHRILYFSSFTIHLWGQQWFNLFLFKSQIVGVERKKNYGKGVVTYGHKTQTTNWNQEKNLKRKEKKE